VQRPPAAQHAEGQLRREPAVGRRKRVLRQLPVEDFLQKCVVSATEAEDVQGKGAGVVLIPVEQRRRGLHGRSGPKWSPACDFRPRMKSAPVMGCFPAG